MEFSCEINYRLYKTVYIIRLLSKVLEILQIRLEHVYASNI